MDLSRGGTLIKNPLSCFLHQEVRGRYLLIRISASQCSHCSLVRSPRRSSQKKKKGVCHVFCSHAISTTATFAPVCAVASLSFKSPLTIVFFFTVAHPALRAPTLRPDASHVSTPNPKQIPVTPLRALTPKSLLTPTTARQTTTPSFRSSCANNSLSSENSPSPASNKMQHGGFD